MQSISDDLYYAFFFAKDFIVPEAKNAKPLCAQISIPLPVCPPAFFHSVLPAINFNYEPPRETDKIHNQMIDRSLPAKMKSLLLERFKQFPEMPFRLS